MDFGFGFGSKPVRFKSGRKAKTEKAVFRVSEFA
jgi:hypothetical protein